MDGIKTSFEVLKKLIVDAEPDALKADGGQKAAGTRLRKAMQDIKNQAQAVRGAVMGARPAKADKTE